MSIVRFIFGSSTPKSKTPKALSLTGDTLNVDELKLDKDSPLTPTVARIEETSNIPVDSDWFSKNNASLVKTLTQENIELKKQIATMLTAQEEKLQEQLAIVEEQHQQALSKQQEEHDHHTLMLSQTYDNNIAELGKVAHEEIQQIISDHRTSLEAMQKQIQDLQTQIKNLQAEKQKSQLQARQSVVSDALKRYQYAQSPFTMGQFGRGGFLRNTGLNTSPLVVPSISPKSSP